MSDAVLAGFSQRREAWRKELRGLEKRLFFSYLSAALLIAFFGILAVFAVGSRFEDKPYNQWSPNAVTFASLGVVIVLGLTIFVPTILTAGLNQKLRMLRRKAVVLLKVQIASLPGKVLLLWQYYGSPEMQWELVTAAEVASILARQYQTDYVLVAHDGYDTAGNVLSFLRSWADNNLARKHLAAVLGDNLGSIREDCRLALYLAEFERTRITTD